MARFSSLFRNLFRKNRVESDLDAEVRSFVEMKTEENLDRGMSPADARRAALIECGGVEQVKESVREVRAGALLEQLGQDLRFGLRMLRKNPGFTLVAVLTIALGIGVNASIFTIFDGVALRPLQLQESNRLVDVYQTIHGEYNRAVLGGFNLLSYPDYKEYRDSSQVFSAVAAYKPELRATLATTKQDIVGQLATCNYFDVVQIRPALGRTFAESDCAGPRTGPVVVLSHAMWQNIFQSDPAIVGKVITLNRQALTVIGVAPAEFRGTSIIPAQFWAPITMAPLLFRTDVKQDDLMDGTNVSWIAVLGRLKQGVTLEQARANLTVIAARIDQRTPGRQTALTVDTATLAGGPGMKRAIFQVGAVVLFAVGLILLIACANIANLMLARAAGRTREVAVRLAVGASRGRLVRQLLTESLLIAFLGGIVGLAVSAMTEPALVRLFVSRIPDGVVWLPVGGWPDFRIVLYALGLTVFTGIAFGLVPALQGTTPDLTHALKNEAGFDRAGRTWMRSALIGGQVAGCMVLLIAAGLLLRGLYHAQTVDPGFDMTHVGAVNYQLTSAGYNDARAEVFNRTLAEGLRSVPGVEDVVPVGSAPLSGMSYGGNFTKVGESKRHQIEFNIVGGHFFSMLDIPLTRGRTFTDAESTNGAQVIVVSEATARELWPGADPIGKQLKAFLFTDAVYEVVGVAKDVEISQLGNASKQYVYIPTGPANQMNLTAMLVRTKDNFAPYSEGIRSVARRADSDLAIKVAPLRDNIDQYVGPARIIVVLAAALGSLGMLLAAIGIYGTVSYSVARRVREIGIRMTLGARASDVLAVILKGAMRPVVIGAIAGVALCAVVSRILSSLLFGVSPVDFVAYGSVGAFLLAVALLASYIPARRALRVDPISAIRHE